MAVTPMKDWMPITNLRRLTRSPNTPPQGPTTKTGRVLIPPTVTTKKPENPELSVRARTNHPTESIWTHWALFAQKLAVQRNR